MSRVKTGHAGFQQVPCGPGQAGVPTPFVESLIVEADRREVRLVGNGSLLLPRYDGVA